MFKTKYASVFDGDANWRKVKAPAGLTYAWDMGSTYVQNPPYFEGMTMTPKPVADIEDARILGAVPRIRSPPTTSRRPARSRRRARPGNI